MAGVFRVTNPGILTVFQDAGRPHDAQYGVPASGAFDRHSWHEANRYVGNDVDGSGHSPAALEILLGGVSLESLTDVWVGVSGAHELGQVHLTTGELLHLDRAKRGMRTYVAIPGGFAADRVLGSRSWDGTSQLGPAPIATGDTLFALSPSDVGIEPIHYEHSPRTDPRPILLEPWPGPQSRLLDSATHSFTQTTWRVSPESSRTGIRLKPDQPTEASSLGTLPSMPTMPGVIQLLPDGQLVVFGPDAPVTGGYPVVAVIPRSQLDALGQARPGDVVRFATTNFPRK